VDIRHEAAAATASARDAANKGKVFWMRKVERGLWAGEVDRACFDFMSEI
jgi:hypothetical protein